MPSRLRSLCAMPLLALTLPWLIGCAATPSAEPPLIARWPKPGPLPAAIQRIDLQPSTSTLSEGQKWLQDSELILEGETRK